MSEISGATAAAGVNSVLIQVHRRARKDEEEICTREDARLLSSNPNPIPLTPFQSRLCFQCSAVDPDPPETNSWYLIHNTSAGHQIEEVFVGLKQDKPIHSRVGTGCLLVGSHLYEMGGYGSIDVTRNSFSNTIRRLDLINLDEGWKSQELPLYVIIPTTVVSGQNIYMFPRGPPFTDKPNHGMQLGFPNRACVYNTTKQKGSVLDYPGTFFPNLSALCVPVEDGILIPIWVGECLRWYRHHTSRWEWEDIGAVDPAMSASMAIHACAISHGILFLYSYGSLFFFKLSDLSFIGQVQLPKMNGLDFMHDTDIHMVLLDNSTLCILWHRGPQEKEKKDESLLHYARVLVSPWTLGVTLLDQAVLRLNAEGVINCISCDFLSIRESGEEKESGDVHMEDAPSKQRSASSSSTQKKQKPEEEDVKNCLKAVMDAKESLSHAVTALNDVMANRGQDHKKLKMSDA